MIDNSEVLRSLLHLFPELPPDCGGDPGLVDASAWNDWTGQPATPDQVRMENT